MKIDYNTDAYAFRWDWKDTLDHSIVGVVRAHELWKQIINQED